MNEKNLHWQTLTLEYNRKIDNDKHLPIEHNQVYILYICSVDIS